jgi:superfamily II DNA or RNA helicase
VAFAPGDCVTVRGERWLVEDATSFGDVTQLDLASLDDSDSRRRCSLLLPFDRPVVHSSVPTVRAVSRRRWIHHFRSRLSDVRIFGQLRAAPRASIDILPFQLEPALALIRGHASRFLLADEVGLGKTVQAGLMIAELQQRRWSTRVLILTPSGLRRQWADELLQRFDIRASVVDAASLSTLAATLPFDVSPWSVDPVLVTSLDFIKQPEVINAAAAQVWDVLVVDEAHQASPGSLRYDAVKALAQRARYVVVITATPHDGDEAAFRALCDLGETDEPDRLLLFRRTREQAGLARARRAHLLPVGPTPATAEMHRLLDAYVARLWQIASEAGQRDVRLVATILGKRAFSSARSLAASLERRLTGLGESAPLVAQHQLPFLDDDVGDQATIPTVVAFNRIEEERSVLGALIEASRRAQDGEPKMCALRRLLRRVPEPVIVFTEYRDTLEAVALAVGALRRLVFLHGGQNAQERRDSISAFTGGAADLLLATDAGAEGLNLHSNCRLVINLELPWNPMRLEQRIGRVDRIGQQRRVHAINLFSRGTAESTVLARLLRRLDRIRLSEIEIAASVICGSDLAIPKPRNTPPIPSPDLHASALKEAARISSTRAACISRSTVADGVIPVTRLRMARTGSSDDHEPPCFEHPSVIVFCRVRLANRAGRLVEDTLIPIRVTLNRLAGPDRRRDVRALAERVLEACKSQLLLHSKTRAAARAKAIEADSATAALRVLERERQIVRSAIAGRPLLVQHGLFERRAWKTHRDAQRQFDTLRDASEKHAHVVRADATVKLARDPEVELLLLVC